jgi:LysR family glycine cleavage system transcriptional activator
VPAGAVHLFDEALTPAVSRSLWERIASGAAAPLTRPADLAAQTLLEEDDDRASTEFLSWRHWLACHDEPTLEPQRWVYLNYTYQQVQAALAGHGVALTRVPLVIEALQRGELVEPFGEGGRTVSPFSYWMLVAPASRARPEVAQFTSWVEAEAKATREAVGAKPPAC